MKAWFLKGHKEIWQIAIEAWTGPHCHMELQFSDGRFFSSTTDLGPRFATFDQLFSQDMNDWDVIDIPAVEADEAIVRELARMVVEGIDGAKQTYDLTDDLLGFLKPVPITISSPDKWICTESDSYILQAIGLFMGYIPQQLAPHAAYLILIKDIPRWQAIRWKDTQSV